MVNRGKLSAALNPWVLLASRDGDARLFGYAPNHHRLGGRSWIVTSRILHLDEAASLARTESGTTYLLGDRIEADDLRDEESRLAFDALVLRRGEVPPETRAWLASCKVARWVALPPPIRSDRVGIETFLAKNMDTYMAARDAVVLSAVRPSQEGGNSGPVAVDGAIPPDSGPTASGSEASRAPTAIGAMFSASYKGSSVVIARPEPSEWVALIGPPPEQAVRDKLDAWSLVAIRGLSHGTRIHALGWRVEIEDVWITSAVTRIGYGPISVTTASGHTYGLLSPQAETLDAGLRRHLEFALASWGFEQVRYA